MRSDNGSEFVNARVQGLFAKKGILHQHSCVYSPQQNGVVERRHRSLLEIARAVMFHSQLPGKLWPYSILYATWILNRLPSRILNWKSPYNLLHNKDADLTVIYPFGSLTFVVNTLPDKKKFDSMSITCVMLGITPDYKAYTL